MTLSFSGTLTASATANTEAGLAHMALLIARVEYPNLDPQRYLAILDTLGAAAREYLETQYRITGDGSVEARVGSLNAYLFKDQGFSGNREKFEDPRNSCLNEVLDRRIGIPITLSVVYMEVARRAGLRIDGVNFPGHFLVRCPDPGTTSTDGLIIDPFHAGALLSERDCRALLDHHAGAEVAYDRMLLAPATGPQIVVRMLLNLKRTYVHMRSFPQAREVTEALLALSPSGFSELRDRGLLAYHLNDHSAALHDLQAYLKLSSLGTQDEEAREEHQQIWEHIRTLRRRVAALN